MKGKYSSFICNQFITNQDTNRIQEDLQELQSKIKKIDEIKKRMALDTA